MRNLRREIQVLFLEISQSSLPAAPDNYWDGMVGTSFEMTFLEPAIVDVPVKGTWIKVRRILVIAVMQAELRFV